MTNLILPVKIAPITPELLERFKASGEYIWTGDFTRVQYLRSFGHWHNAEGYIAKEPTHYLPDGLPSPDEAVEVLERELLHVSSWDDTFEGEALNPSTGIPHQTMVSVFTLPSGKVEVSK